MSLMNCITRIVSFCLIVGVSYKLDLSLNPFNSHSAREK